MHIFSTGKLMKDFELISTNEVCKLLCISRSTLLRWRKSNHFPKGTVLGERALYWNKVDIINWWKFHKRVQS
ncbi:helix-turn-helix transcriptional regulator [Ferrimonas pelagia]|uniref:helix-turn-helix transcriptional regulator n=1 Tax=Ferrimonas pelagia TaxID=1177826 RepID=UPI003CD0AC92